MTDPQIAEIAAKLTAAQREAIPHIPEQAWRMPMRWMVLVGYSLEHLGLMKRTWFTDRSIITPLGQSVAAYLKEQSNAE
jgi:hypothetical protein